MKKFVLGLLFFISLFFIVSNQNIEVVKLSNLNGDLLISTETETLNDGSYIVYELYEESSKSNNIMTYSLASTYSSNSSYTKTGTRTVTKYDSNDKLLWQYVLTATYFVNEGVSATCTSSSYSKTINNTFWKFSNGSTSYSDNTAYGKGKFTYKVLWLFSSDTINIDIELSC